MTSGMDTGRRALDEARAVADAVLYEGYVLFPYRASATKNRFRWQFGVLVPESQVRHDPSESSEIVSQVLVRGGRDARVGVSARFLRPRLRQVERATAGVFEPVDRLEVAGELHTTWDEGIEHEEGIGLRPVDELVSGAVGRVLRLDADGSVEDLGDGEVVGRVVHSSEAVDAVLEVGAERLADDVVRLTTRVRNVTGWDDAQAPRDVVLRHAVVGLHLLLQADGARFASAIDPPAWAQPYADTCDNVGTYPVLVGSRESADAPQARVVLSAPIILHDHPEIAPESVGDSFDATEIDELLTLAVMGLTEEEKREARATDPRAAAIVERADTLPPEVLERLHGAVRELRPAGTATPYGPGGMRPNEPSCAQPLGDELADFLGVGEEPLERVVEGGVEIAVGGRVRLEPNRRADAQDLFVADRIARVRRIWRTVDDGDVQVGVILEDDPAAELHEWYGRYLYFHLDEIRPVEEGAS